MSRIPTADGESSGSNDAVTAVSAGVARVGRAVVVIPDVLRLHQRSGNRPVGAPHPLVQQRFLDTLTGGVPKRRRRSPIVSRAP